MASAKEKATKFAENLNSAGATATSQEGGVTVTVAPNGSLTDLRIADAALRSGSGSRLAAEIMRTTREAQRQAATHVVAAFTELGGDSSEATKMLTGWVPPPEPQQPAQGQLMQDYAAPPPPAQQPAPHQQPTHQPPTRQQLPHQPPPRQQPVHQPPRPQQAAPTHRPAEPPAAPPRRTARPDQEPDQDDGSSVLRSDDW
jgi:DNA-binding protein YbaB